MVIYSGANEWGVAQLLLPLLQLIGMWLYYFKSPFDIFDFFLLVVGWVDVALEILSISDIPLAIRVFSFLRIVRVVRILKLFKVG